MNMCFRSVDYIKVTLLRNLLNHQHPVYIRTIELGMLMLCIVILNMHYFIEFYINFICEKVNETFGVISVDYLRFQPECL